MMSSFERTKLELQNLMVTKIGRNTHTYKPVNITLRLRTQVNNGCVEYTYNGFIALQQEVPVCD